MFGIEDSKSLPMRVIAALESGCIKTKEEARQRTREELLRIPNCGPVTADEIAAWAVR